MVTNMKTVAIIQARMGSSRLPGKVLADLAGLPVVGWVVRAARETIGIDEVWVATSTSPSDDAVAKWCEANKVSVHRGSESDVLDRYAGATRKSNADVVVRVTADCPFLDPAVMAQTIRLRAVSGGDYASNCYPPSWPDGLDCEVVTAKALLAAAEEARRDSEREHVTSFVRNNRARFPAETLVAPLPDLQKERWTLDTPEDEKFLQAVAKDLPKGRAPSHLEVLAVLDRTPKLRDINRHEIRNSGFAISLAADKIDGGRRFDRSQKYLDRAERVIPLDRRHFQRAGFSFRRVRPRFS
jgi:glutamate-1-semialdehyde 2,1-aminomutase/spore coat polysaccharide biosynthesis protein SpsF